MVDVSPRRKLESYSRLVIATTKLLPLLLEFARDRKRFILFGEGRDVDSEVHTQRAKKIRDLFLELGPTFIKLGQTLSTRPDAIPSEYIREFEYLQDEVPPAPWSEAKKVLEDELGEVDKRFDEFDTEAISGASLGQVYRARIEGEGEVAVKVRRPNIEERIEADLELIDTLLSIGLRFMDESRAYSVENLVDQVRDTIYEEIDYTREAEMLKTIKENLSEDDRVIIPRVIDSHSGKAAFTMEFVEGTKLTNLEELDDLGIDRAKLASDIRQLYLHMILIDGVFHADPHPGNLAVTPEGRVIIYDFGMSTEISEELRENITDFYMAIGRQDYETILGTMVEMGTLDPEALEEAEEEISDVIDLAVQEARGADIDNFQFRAVIENVEDAVYKFPFRMPKDMALVLRVAMIGDGVLPEVDPGHDVVKVTADFFLKNDYIDKEDMQKALELTSPED